MGDVTDRAPAGPCSICGHERIFIKPGCYACPGFYGSPMHWCSSAVFMHRDGMTEQEAQEAMRKRLESVYNCTLEEYLKVVNPYIRELQERTNA